MGNRSSLHHITILFLVLILVICLAAHFVIDLQPGHRDYNHTIPASQIQHMALHSGGLVGIIPGITFIILIVFTVGLYQLIPLFDSHSIPLPPPIPA